MPALVALLIPFLLLALLFGGSPAFAVGDEPSTSTIRIRLKGPTLRVRCRGGDCDVSITSDGTSYAVTITRTRYGAPFTFSRTVQNPTNLAIETGLGNDRVTVIGGNLPGFLRIGTSSGDDVIDVSGTSTGLKTSVYGGTGNDAISFAPGTIGGKFKLKSHGGDDSVTVGGGTFATAAGFDGGPGTDTFVTTTQLFTIPPVIRGFEQ